MEEVQQQTQPISDDQELAKALAGINDDGGYEETPNPTITNANAEIVSNRTSIPQPQSATVQQSATPSLATADGTATINPNIQTVSPQQTNSTTLRPASIPAQRPNATSPEPNDHLAPIREEAIETLKPLVSKLHLPPDEQFEAYILLIRNTDDKSLIEPAFMAARAITDDTRRAEALLDVIKEIDYLSPEEDQ